MSESWIEETLHAGHRSIRLKGFDYASAGAYFLTICAHQRKCVLSRINGTTVDLSLLGQIVREHWLQIPQHFQDVVMHEFVVMPNHLHGIIELAGVGAQHAAPQVARSNVRQVRAKPGSLGAIVRSFKAVVTQRARAKLMWTGAVWQRNYFERILRDGKEYAAAARYIAENPLRWAWDKENPESKG